VAEHKWHGVPPRGDFYVHYVHQAYATKNNEPMSHSEKVVGHPIIAGLTATSGRSWEGAARSPRSTEDAARRASMELSVPRSRLLHAFHALQQVVLLPFSVVHRLDVTDAKLDAQLKLRSTRGDPAVSKLQSEVNRLHV